MILVAVTLILKLCAVYCMSPVIKELLTPMKSMGEACGYASCTEPQAGHLNVHVVPHTHGELGQTQTFYSYYSGDNDNFEHSTRNMKQILDYTISELWANTNRKFTFSDMPYFFYWWSHRDETVRRMVYELLRQGRLTFVGGGWSMSDESTTSYHAIIDHFTYSLRKINNSFLDCGRPLVAWQVDAVGHSREFASLAALTGFDGLFVSPVGCDDEVARVVNKEMEFVWRGSDDLVAWQVDAVGHSREFASLAALMGFDGLFVSPAGCDDEVARVGNKEMEFVWRGSDDLGAESDIFSHIPFDGMLPPPGFCFSTYCSDPLLITSSDTFHNIHERANLFIESMQHRQAPHYSTRNVMVLMGGTLAYSDASIWFENIDKLIQYINMQAPKKKVYAFYSTPACYLKAVYNENPILRTKQDDFYPQAMDLTSYAAGGYTSRPALKYLAREGHRYLQMAKQLFVTARLVNYGRFFEDFQWINGVFQDHHVITGELRPHVKDFYVKRMDILIQQSVLLLQDAFNKLRHSPETTRYFKCQFNISRCINTSGPQPFIVIYNPLAWPVTMPVRLPIRDREYIVYSPQLERVTAATMPVPKLVQQIPGRNSTLDTELVFIAKDIPPMGFRSYYFKRRTLGWERPKRSLIKKINQKKPKKYLVRQTNTSPDDGSLFKEPEYEYFEDTLSTTESGTKFETKIVFGNVSGYDNGNVYRDVMTPKSKDVEVTRTTEAVVEITTVDDFRERRTGGDSATVPETTTLPTTSPTRTTTTQPPTTTKQPTTTTELPTTTTATTNVDSEPESEEEKVEANFWKGYEYMKTNKPFIRNRYVRINLDNSMKIRNISIANGIKMPFDVQMFYYVSDDPDRLGKKDVRPPGAYVFRSMDNKQEPIQESPETVVYKSKLAQEIHCTLSPYAGFHLRLYAGSPGLEVDWAVGPVPVEDGLGKDVFIKYVTNLDNQGVFYTDSNGRQTIKRIRNRRPTYEPLNKDPVAGNIYPVTSKIYIEDTKRNIRFSVLTDRAQGGTSLKDGEISLMLHRRLLTEDPIKEDMNETQFGKGVVIRGQHYLYISKADYRPTKVFEKKLAKEIELRPQVLVSSVNGYGVNTRNIWKKHRNEYSALKSKLPVGIHILTLEEWGPNNVLMRLENYLEKSDAVLSGVKTVYLNEIFKDFTFLSVKEMTLGGNILLKDWTPLDWKKQLFYKNFNDAYGNVTEDFSDDTIRGLEDVELDKPVILSPQQIRTFVLTYEFNRAK